MSMRRKLSCGHMVDEILTFILVRTCSTEEIDFLRRLIDQL